MTNLTRPPHGFDDAEFEQRLVRSQNRMTDDRLDALVVTSAPNVRYFTGFNTQFWESPTRPWFVVVPREGEIIAVIPEIGAPGMAGTWVKDIRTWMAPSPDDDGVSLLSEVLARLPTGNGIVVHEINRQRLTMLRNDFPALQHSTFEVGLP